MSVPGTSERRASGGFTLVEVLVVLLLIAVATAAGLTLVRPRQADLADEALRVAAWLDRLALEARLSGQSTAWRCAEGNALAFERAGRDAEGRVLWGPWPVADRMVLAPSVRVLAVERGGTAVACARRQVFAPGGWSEDWALDLRDDAGGTRRVVGDALGRFAVADADIAAVRR